jgi:CxxC motif-containing protein
MDNLETRNLICIGCPMGCPLTVRMENGQITVTGNTCKRGADYGQKEVTNPTRIVTTTVRVEGGASPMVSVKTATDIPKGKIMDCISALKGVTIKAPVSIGDVILHNAADTGVDILATKNIAAANSAS